MNSSGKTKKNLLKPKVHPIKVHEFKSPEINNLSSYVSLIYVAIKGKSI